MSRHAKFDSAVIYNAYASVKIAVDIREYRKHLAVILSDKGLDMDQTAGVLGISRSAVGRLQKEARNPDAPKPSPRGGRHNQRLTVEEEKDFLEPWVVEATTAGMIIVPPLKEAFEKRIGKKVHHSQVYRMLNRHGWRKVAPDSIHPKSDLEAQDSWKKNFKRWFPNVSILLMQKGKDLV